MTTLTHLVSKNKLSLHKNINIIQKITCTAINNSRVNGQKKGEVWLEKKKGSLCLRGGGGKGEGDKNLE